MSLPDGLEGNMQIMKNKKVWFFLLLGVMLATTVCLWRSGIDESRAYANGRVVERQDNSEIRCCVS